MKGFYKGLLLATGVFAAYIAGTGATVYTQAMTRSSTKRDRNYDPDEVKEYIVPTERSSVYRHAAYNYNVWWNTQDTEKVEVIRLTGCGFGEGSLWLSPTRL